MFPGNCCREGRIDAKMAKRETAKEREASPDVVHVPGGGNIFGGDDSFQAAKERYETPRTNGSANKQGKCFVLGFGVRHFEIVFAKRMSAVKSLFAGCETLEKACVQHIDL